MTRLEGRHQAAPLLAPCFAFRQRHAAAERRLQQPLGQVDILFVGDFDDEASPLGAKDLGELTAVSVAPAIANAIYRATGKRVRDLPIALEKLL